MAAPAKMLEKIRSVPRRWKDFRIESLSRKRENLEGLRGFFDEAVRDINRGSICAPCKVNEIRKLGGKEAEEIYRVALKALRSKGYFHTDLGKYLDALPLDRRLELIGRIERKRDDLSAQIEKIDRKLSGLRR